MALGVAVNNIPNLTISVNKSDVSDNVTLLEAYKELNCHLNDINTKCPVKVLADGHGSQFDEKVLFYIEKNQMWLFTFPPDTSGVTQMHDQIKNRLHDEYEKSKSELYTQMRNLNRLSFMRILGDVWNKLATPDLIVMSIGCNRTSSGMLKLLLNQQSLHHPDLLVALFCYHQLELQRRHLHTVYTNLIKVWS